MIRFNLIVLMVLGTLAHLCHWDVVPLSEDRFRHLLDVIVVRASRDSISILSRFDSTLLYCVSNTIILIGALEAVL